MKRYFAVLISCNLLLVALCLNPVRNEIAWREATIRDTERAYSTYLDRRHGDPSHRDRCLDRLEQLHNGDRPRPRISSTVFWWWVCSQVSADACIEYLSAWPTGARRYDAARRFERILWDEAARLNTVASFQAYLDHDPQPANVNGAKRRIRALQSDSARFLDAEARGTVKAWRAFLRNYSGHRCAGVALANLAEVEPRSIFRLAREDSADFRGAAFADDSFGVLVDKHQFPPLTFCIPAGTYGKAADPNVRDFVTTMAITEKLTEYGVIAFWTPSASVGMRRRQPDRRDTFTMQPAPPDDDLARLVAGLAAADPGLAARQAAVWIVADDATYAELRRYVVNPLEYWMSGRPGDERWTFGPEEAVSAMQAIDDAGLGLRQRAIWNDRREIFWALLTADADGWQFLAEADPDSLGSQWWAIQAAMKARLSALEPCLLPILKARPFEVDVESPPGTLEAAWLIAYLREAGVDVQWKSSVVWCDPRPDEPSDTWISFNDTLAVQGRAIAEAIQCALDLPVVAADSLSVALGGGSLSVTINLPGTRDAAPAGSPCGEY
jgi:hypothetical protein